MKLSRPVSELLLTGTEAFLAHKSPAEFWDRAILPRESPESLTQIPAATCALVVAPVKT